MSRHVTIHSDGTGHGTVLLDADGNKLDNIMSCNISIEANSFAVATVEIAKVETIVNAGVETVTATCPLCMGFIEHVCDGSFQGSGQTGNTTTSSLFDFEVCGQMTFSAIGTLTCYINKTLPHSVHTDIKHGTTWGAM